MGASDCSRINTMREIMSASENSKPQSSLSTYRYYLLGAAYVFGTSLAFARIRRQPYSQSIKMEQYETVFKGTTLAAVVAGVALSGKVNQARSADWQSEQRTNQDERTAGK